MEVTAHDRWPTSLRGLPTLEHSSIDGYFLTKCGAAKARDEGMRLWMDEYVRSMLFAEDRANNRLIVSARVRPSMRHGYAYYSSLLSLGDEGILGGSCDCKSGASGTC